MQEDFAYVIGIDRNEQQVKTWALLVTVCSATAKYIIHALVRTVHSISAHLGTITVSLGVLFLAINPLFGYKKAFESTSQIFRARACTDRNHQGLRLAEPLQNSLEP